MSSKGTELIIFDCDGVLIDSEIISAATMIELLKPLGIDVDFAHIQQYFLGRSFPTVAQIISEQFHATLPENFEEQYRNQLLEAFESQLQPSAGIIKTLEQITVPICVATSSSPQRARRSLEITDLLRFFDGDIFTASQVTHGKPAPDLFLFVAKQFDVSPKDCLVVEDSVPGLEAAEAAGMKALRYLGGSHFDMYRKFARTEVARVPCFDSWQDFFNMSQTTE